MCDNYVWGTENSVADANEANTLLQNTPPTIDFALIAQAQRTDPELQRVLSSPQSSSLQIAKLKLYTGDQTIFYISTGVPWPFVPLSSRKVVFDSLHSLSHPETRATHLITTRYVWPSINKEINYWTKTCIQCQRSKVQCHTFAPPKTFTTPGERFDTIHIDLVGPSPPSRGYQYLLTCIDRFNRWPEAFPLTEITADSSRWNLCSGLDIKIWRSNYHHYRQRQTIWIQPLSPATTTLWDP